MTMLTAERDTKQLVSVRVTPATKARIEELVQATGLEPADFLRLALMRGMVGIGDVVKPAPMTQDEIKKLVARNA